MKIRIKEIVNRLQKLKSAVLEGEEAYRMAINSLNITAAQRQKAEQLKAYTSILKSEIRTLESAIVKKYKSPWIKKKR